MPGTTCGAGSSQNPFPWGEPAFPDFVNAMLAERTCVDHQQMRYYAAGISGLIGIFVLAHWVRLVFTRYRRLSNSSLFTAVSAPLIAASRLTRYILLRKLPGFSSVGSSLVVAAYVGINVVITFTHVDFSLSGAFANRCGWMLAGNFLLVVFLSLKNTPLAFLTAYSYERLNPLHQIAGLMTCLYLILHSVTYTVNMYQAGLVWILQEKKQHAAVGAGFAILSIFISAVIIRPWCYEAFYIIHIASFVVAIVCAGFHHPIFSQGVAYIMVITGAIWIADRLLRVSRVLLNSINNEAVVHPLPNGGTRITLSKRIARAVPGKHCSVWLPGIRKLEMHPFTIASTSPMQFVVKSYDGFTHDLHKYATANPGGKLMASVDGPYGTFPDPVGYDKIVLVAGGSGASFTAGLVVNMLELMDLDEMKEIVFIWTVKDEKNFEWFSEQIDTLLTHTHAPRIRLSLHVTRSAGVGAVYSPSQFSQPGDAKNAHVDTVEKIGPSNLGGGLSRIITRGRPDTTALIREAISSTAADHRILVAACGPSSLMNVVRDTTARCIHVDGPGIELHCEHFGW